MCKPRTPRARHPPCRIAWRSLRARVRYTSGLTRAPESGFNYTILVIHGFATPDGTGKFAEQFADPASHGFYRIVNDLYLSSLGLGTYLGEADNATDRGYEEAVLAALKGGINCFDTALGYRDGRSERALGAALRIALNANMVQRDQIFLGTKAGFLTAGAIPQSLEEDDVAGAIHSMAPDFLEDQLDRSRVNLGLDTLDVFYIHNPEIQLRFVTVPVFEARLQSAFERCERLVRERRIRWYGAATWSGFRTPGELNLERVIDLARYVGGDEHHFRFIQLPFNMGMVEAYQNRDEQGVSVLKAADRAGVTAVASATLDQARLAKGIPAMVADRIPGFTHDAARSIQFTRSTPGIAVALVGMSSALHVRENLEVAGVPPMGWLDYEKLYRPFDA